MRCPKCSSTMETVTQNSIEVDVCSGCRGIWFDMLEHEDLKKLAGSEAIDKGDPRIGKEFNKKADYTCPKCEGHSMIKMVDLKQSHIWYEACSKCYGVFFDAGEFKDFKNETLFDRVRSLLTGPRD